MRRQGGAETRIAQWLVMARVDSTALFVEGSTHGMEPSIAC
jgi:hypothetical protein